jgi:hypothetical protein
MRQANSLRPLIAGIATAMIVGSIISLFFPALRIVGTIVLCGYFGVIAYRFDLQSEFWRWVYETIRAARK